MEILRRSLVALTLLAAGCEFVREPTPLASTGEQIVVHSLLHAGSDTVTVLVQRMRLVQGSTAPSVRPVSGADVRISGGGGELRLREAPAGFRRCGPLDAIGADPNRAEPGCYAAVLSGGIRAGGRYELKIAIPGGGTIQGAAVIPEAPTILAPTPHTRFVLGRRGTDGYDYVGEVPVRWRVDEDGGDFQLSVRADALFRDGKIAQGGRCDTRSIESSGQYIGSQRIDSASVRFVLLGACPSNPGRGGIFMA